MRQNISTREEVGDAVFRRGASGRQRGEKDGRPALSLCMGLIPTPAMSMLVNADIASVGGPPCVATTAYLSNPFSDARLGHVIGGSGDSACLRSTARAPLCSTVEAADSRNWCEFHFHK